MNTTSPIANAWNITSPTPEPTTAVQQASEKETPAAPVKCADLQAVMDVFESGRHAHKLQAHPMETGDAVNMSVGMAVVGAMAGGVAVVATGGALLIPIAIGGGMAAATPAMTILQRISHKRSEKRGGRGDPLVHPEELTEMFRLQEQAGRFEKLVIATLAQRTLDQHPEAFQANASLLVRANHENILKSVAPSQEETDLANRIVDFMFAVQRGGDYAPAMESFRTFPENIRQELKPMLSGFAIPELVWDVVAKPADSTSER